MDRLHIPIIRRGKEYESLEKTEIKHYRNGEVVAEVSQSNAGLIRRDMRKIAESREVLRNWPTEKLVEICGNAGEAFLNDSLPLGENGPKQSPGDYIESLSATTGLPHALCRKNMGKVHHVLTNMSTILRGLTRGLDYSALDEGIGEQAGVPVSFYAVADSLGVILPSNSPGVNSLWIPSIALKIPVVLKPGREEPWTPFRLIQAFLAAGCPPEAFCFYPTDHEGSNLIIGSSGRSLLFGDDNTVARYANNPAVQVHGTGRSKVLIGEDQIERWPELIDVLVDSIAENSGRSCINASAIVVPAHGDEIAEALARRLVQIVPRTATDDQAMLAGFANPQFAEYINDAVEEGLTNNGAEDVTARYREGKPRKIEFEGSNYLLPTIVRCDSFEHPLANREFLFPYASVVEVPQDKMLEQIGPSLVVTAITKDQKFIQELLASDLIDRLNIGPAPTSKVSWDQPHEGNLFEFLYKRRAVLMAEMA